MFILVLSFCDSIYANTEITNFQSEEDIYSSCPLRVESLFRMCKKTQGQQDAIGNFPALGWGTAPTLWTNVHESALTTALLARAANVNSTISTAINYGVNQSQGAVREARNSFLIEV
jgi:hypothetical protein